MSRPPELYQWNQQIAIHFPGLSKPMAMGLALWSLGMVVVGACSLPAVADWWSCRLGQKGDAVRERLRDVYREKQAKAGKRRCQLEVEACWAPWLGWVLEDWSGTQLAVALDATSLGQRFVVLAVSVLYRGCAVPVAWKVLRAEQKHPWKPEWLALLEHFKGIVPARWTVLVLTDRGLYAKWLFEGIRALGWHPMLRVNSGGTFDSVRQGGVNFCSVFSGWVACFVKWPGLLVPVFGCRSPRPVFPTSCSAGPGAIHRSVPSAPPRPAA